MSIDGGRSLSEAAPHPLRGPTGPRLLVPKYTRPLTLGVSGRVGVVDAEVFSKCKSGVTMGGGMGADMFASSLLAAIVALAGKGLLEMVRADNEMTKEQYRTQLQKSQFYFEEQFKAVADFGRYFRSIIPAGHGVEWEDGMSRVAEELSETHYDYIVKYISQNDVLFDESVMELLLKCRTIVSTYIEERDVHERNGGDGLVWQDDEWKYGDEYYKAIEKAHSAMKSVLQNQLRS